MSEECCSEGYHLKLGMEEGDLVDAFLGQVCMISHNRDTLLTLYCRQIGGGSSSWMES
jgi:hypothetical protein